MISDKNLVDAAEGKTYFILNYGCQMNESDAEHYAGQLEEMGYARADDFHNADIIVVNTCCVRESAEKRILGKIGELKRVKENHPGQVICVAGCMAQKDGEKLIKKHPQIDLLIGTAHVNSFKEILTDFLADKGGRIYDDMAISGSEFEGNRVRQSGFSAWIPIMYGCNNFCTYCIVPYVRGRELSRPMDAVLDEVRRCVDGGYKEITLLGQNVNSYGKGLDEGEKMDFSDLLNLLCAVPGDYHIRFMTSHPKDASRKLIDTIAAQPHLCKHLHLPVQCGSDRLLARMNRHYTVEHYLDLIEYARARVPGITFSSDIIVGFPGETEEDFQGTLDLIRRVGYMQLFTFIYSRREGTPAAGYPDPTPRSEKTGRMARLLKTQDEIAMALVKAQVGQTVRVLVEGFGRAEGTLTGRLDNNLTVEFAGEPALLGQYASVRLTGARATVLLGEWAPPVSDKIGS